ncbi:DEAD/DEAH box helicase family protein [Limnothrix sp. FACHB-1083]|uniref:DEAD/DEAH box helicase n=1 Tax=unclassified Limnothrix TaxID=2632864 RepID=UPI0016816232|nr:MULTISPECIES: DEAD/DEAH box helicase family protein [unclassified Limnothrix]MBD2160933.1 DEAD/DEAH box helicase family protein [Limnothrix sp. FACHB-1083]MBD2191634.1 DEAD/DEAH box helicase family protein [Limnothrix sp. FACHB-1088]
MPTKKVQTVGMIIPNLLRGDVEGWKNTGWHGVTQTTAELLSYWFEEDRDGANFHPCQQQAIETIIYCHEILGIKNPYQLYEEFSPNHPEVSKLARSKVLQDELNPITFPKYCLKMATGSGKTWVLNALMAWQYFNAINDEKPGMFTKRFLIVTPGKEVQKRILDAVRLGGNADINKPLFMPPGARWRDRFFFELYEPTDFRENLTLTDDAFVMVTNWQQFRFSNDDPSLWEDLMGEREEIPKAEIIGDLLTEYPDLCVLNDEAHHVHANKRPNPTTQKDEELIWRRFMTYLHQRQLANHSDSEYCFFQQIDFSATPFFGSGDKKDYFPHIVYDYPLAQASGDMLVKQLFLEQRQGANLIDLDFKAERAEAEGKKRGEILGLSRGQKIMLEIGKSKLEQLTEEFRAKGIDRKPVMLVLAEETAVADLVGEHFNSLADSEGSFYSDERMLVYHSNLKTTEYAEAEKRLDDIDNDQNPLQVVISVLSVREGFDRTNICVIVMLRASEADLLLEQIVGRGLRLMFPRYKPEYGQIQELKSEARQQLLNQEAPSNAFDCLFLVEHPKFKDFYENYLRNQGFSIASGDSSAQTSAGDLVTVDAEVDRIAKYDLAWATQIYDQTPIPNLADIEIEKLGHFQVPFKLQKQMTAQVMITDVHVETETKAKTWNLQNDYFDYSFFLQQMARTITQTGKMKHLTAFSADIAALVDEYVTRRLFTEEIDFTEPANYQVLQNQQVVDFIANQVRSAVQEAMGDIQFQPGAVWRKLSDVSRLMMRQKNMVLTRRCIYPSQAVQSQSGGFERQVITKLLNPSPEVLAFAKLDRKHDLIIPWRDDRGIQRKYEPDFVVKTAERMFLLETKGDHLLTDSGTRLKAQAAKVWCDSASRVSPPKLYEQPQEWEYLVLKESVFDVNEGASFAALLPIMRQEAAGLVAGLYGELGLQL